MKKKRFYDKNFRPFTAICGCHFGRQVIYTNATEINENNVVDELNKALSIHEQNVVECNYLERYYSGDQPALYREKKNRPEINNKVVVNIAKFVVDSLTADAISEPIQYVLRQVDEAKTEELNLLNKLLAVESKDYYDTELVRDSHIFGTSYRYIGQNDDYDGDIEESPFYISTEAPQTTFVCYFSNTKKPAFGCLIREDENGTPIYNVYTRKNYFFISDGKITETIDNGRLAIPVIEYPRNSRRLSDIEVTISLTDEINKLSSDRANAVEGYVASWIKFVNCEIDIEKFREVRDEGFFSVTSNNGSEAKADVDIMSQELNQADTQVAMDDLFNKLLMIQGIANRESNTGGDTGSAVILRNGHWDSEKRAELDDPIFKKAERTAIKVFLHFLRVNKGIKLFPSDIEIKVTRSKFDNALTKAEVLKMLLDCGVKPEIAIKEVGLFSDPEQVASDSKARMDILYPTEIQQPVVEVANNGDNEQN